MVIFNRRSLLGLFPLLFLFQHVQIGEPFSIYDMTRSLTNFTFGSSLLPEEDMSTVGLCRKQGYPVEIHHILTEDGAILEMHRIPHGKNGSSTSSNSTKFPVIVQHGNFQSSADWLLNSPDTESLGFYLANSGYDVWLGNQRGNEYSTNHSTLEVQGSAFWNFSFHEMGMYDVPAMLDYVTKVSGKRKAHYIGFSMGTTAFFIGLSKQPEYNEKVGIGIAMGPSIFEEHYFDVWLNLVTPFIWGIQIFHRFAGEMPVLPQFLANLLHRILPVICHPKIDLIGVCISVFQIWSGQDHGKITKEKLHMITKVSPSSSSMKALIHRLQQVGTNRFGEFDYGTDQNKLLYGKEHPPDYNLTNVRAPIAILVGPNDVVSHREDAKTLAKKLPNLVDFHSIPYEHFTHLDFCYASDVSSLVYKHVITLLGEYDDT